ncbi:MAG: Maf family protein [Oscillospiraceae bacterium]|nr:Maf family protein [Oscillospiraceae bacterium]
MILASASPRRRELLCVITDEFTVEPPDVSEEFPAGMRLDEAVMLLALRKAAFVAEKHPGELVIGADTVVVLDGAVLGKPADEDDAFRMLSALSGKTHTVYTGAALVRDAAESVFCVSTRVTFRELASDEIREYISTGEPMDKAGAYGIQKKGALFVREIHGDYFNVVGLPLCSLYSKLNEFCLL